MSSDRELSFTTYNRTLVLNIPYVETENAEWSHENIKVKVDIPSLLQMVLPMGCLTDDNCCAVKYAKQDEAKVREAKARAVLNLPVPDKEAAEPDDYAICGAGYEGCF